MNVVSDLSYRAPYLIMDEKGLLNLVLNEKYTSELQRKERAYNYSYVSFEESSPVNTIGFTDLGIITLAKDFNARKCKSDERLHTFNFHLESHAFTAKPEKLAITPYIDTSHATDDTLSNFSSQIIEFIKGLNTEGLHGILVSFLRRYDDGQIVKNYASHVTPILVAHQKDRSIVFIFDHTGFELMGRQEEYGIIQIPTLRSSNSNCFAYSFSVLKKCISQPQIIDDLLSKTSCSAGGLERLSFEDLPSELMQYLESVSNKIKYIQQTPSNKKILNSPVAKVWIKTLKQDGCLLLEEKLISCNLYNKTYKLALKLLGNSSSLIALQLRDEYQNFQRQQILLELYQEQTEKDSKVLSIRKTNLKTSIIITGLFFAYNLFLNKW